MNKKVRGIYYSTNWALEARKQKAREFLTAYSDGLYTLCITERTALNPIFFKGIEGQILTAYSDGLYSALQSVQGRKESGSLCLCKKFHNCHYAMEDHMTFRPPDSTCIRYHKKALCMSGNPRSFPGSGQKSNRMQIENYKIYIAIDIPISIR